MTELKNCRMYCAWACLFVKKSKNETKKARINMINNMTGNMEKKTMMLRQIKMIPMIIMMILEMTMDLDLVEAVTMIQNTIAKMMEATIVVLVLKIAEVVVVAIDQIVEAL